VAISRRIDSIDRAIGQRQRLVAIVQGIRVNARDAVRALRASPLVSVSGFFGALALLLSACGLYGVTAYAVSRRRTEIELRLALGARPAGILRMVLGRVAVVVLAGIVIGALVSAWLGRYVSTLIFGLAPHDPLLLLGAAGTLFVVGMLAGFVPARRAASLDPASVLREI
jgi:ABC-type antimicrobial peptide transport system permease subunit